MKNIVMLVSIITFLSFIPKDLTARQRDNSSTKNYVGSINKNLKVVLSLTKNGNKLKGFYYYEKIGVNINLVGETVDDLMTLNELSEQGKIVAKITLKQSSIGLNGTWQSLTNKKALVVNLLMTNKEIPQVPVNVLGDYNFKNNYGCKITISITKSNKGYHFYYQSSKRHLKGQVTFSRDLGSAEVYINLHGIEWAEDNGDVAKEENVDEDRVLPTVVQGLLSETEIVIQNTGNAMNYYVKLGDCDEKFIRLAKWKKPN